MSTNLRRTLMLLLVGVSSVGLGACGVMREVGEGTESAGEKIQDEAEGHMDPDDRDDPDEEDNA